MVPLLKLLPSFKNYYSHYARQLHCLDLSGEIENNWTGDQHREWIMQAISWRDRQAIEDWVTRMATAEFDPAIPFSSIDVVSDPEKCSEKVRFKGTSEAILFLIRKERREGKLIKQLPYRCDLCKGFHNTHLIDRSTLNKLVL